jgi:hypothetical protein
MKPLLTIFTLLFTLMFSSTGFAGWTKVGESSGGTFYVDFEKIRKVDGYVYYWTLTDNLKPTNTGTLSSKIYHQGDCKLFRYKYLSFSHHKEPMGGGTGKTSNPKNPDWRYPPPNSAMETILKSVCSR